MSDAGELKRAGLKATLPRLRILDLFQESSTRHLSAEDIYRLLLERNIEVGLATVYRVLTQLQHAGLIKQAKFDAGRTVYELENGEHHDHLVCTDCGRVHEFTDETMELNRPGFRGGCLVKVKQPHRRMCRVGCSSLPQPRPAGYSRWMSAGAYG